jgi:fringe protein
MNIDDYSWWCHFDDDNYVNVPALRRLLANFDPSLDYYIGRPSTELPLRVDATAHQSQDAWPVTRAAFWFATGGAGICVSRSLLTKLAAAYIRNERFANIGTHIRLPDDVTLGYIIGETNSNNLQSIFLYQASLQTNQLRSPISSIHISNR